MVDIIYIDWICIDQRGNSHNSTLSHSLKSSSCCSNVCVCACFLTTFLIIYVCIYIYIYISLLNHFRGCVMIHLRIFNLALPYPWIKNQKVGDCEEYLDFP